jgi:hypothetical protein
VARALSAVLPLVSCCTPAAANSPPTIPSHSMDDEAGVGCCSRSLQVRRQAGRRVQALCVSATTTTWLLLYLVKGGSAKL